MTNNRVDILEIFDRERASSGDNSAADGIAREWSYAGKECRILYVPPDRGDITRIIAQEKEAARVNNYRLEWKTYAHDLLPDIPEKLIAAGFVAADPETVLYLELNPAAMAAFPVTDYEIRLVQDEQGLQDYAEISADIGRKNTVAEYQSLLHLMHNNPNSLQIHIAYHRDEPVSAGRLHLRSEGKFAELAGGRTKVLYRGQGFFTAVVASRLWAALDQHKLYALVDALPTSAPILRKRGFHILTQTQPFIFS